MATIAITTSTTVGVSTEYKTVKNMTEGEAFINGWIANAIHKGLTGGKLGDWKDVTLYYADGSSQLLTYCR